MTRCLATGVMALALGACSVEATDGSVGGQTLARVNGDPITSGDVELELALLPPELRAGAREHILEGLVDRKLLAQDARARGDEQSAEFVRLQRRSRELLLAQRTADLVAARSTGVTAGDANTVLKAHPELGADRRLFTIDRVVFSLPASDAQRALAKAQSIGELMAVLAQAKIAASLERQEWDSAEIGTDRFSLIDVLRQRALVIRETGNQREAFALVSERPAPRSRDEALTAIRKHLLGERISAAIGAHEKALRSVSKIVVMQGKTP